MTEYRHKESMFREFCARLHGENSGLVHSYANALNTLDELFAAYNPLGISGSVWDIYDESLLMEIYRFIKSEEHSPSPDVLAAFPEGRSSHLRNRFCSSAVLKLISFNKESLAVERAVHDADSAEDLGRRLAELLRECGRGDAGGTAGDAGQYLFRQALMKIYGWRCAVTGISAPPVLTACRISERAKDTADRLSPANGICLSATFAVAFGHHLIAFGRDSRMMIAPAMRQYLEDDATRRCFEPYEGKMMILPSDGRFLPDQKLLGYHRRQCRL